MAVFVGLTGLNNEKYTLNIDRISFQEVVSHMPFGHFAPDGKWHSWTVVREQGQPDRFVKEYVEDILKSARRK